MNQRKDEIDIDDLKPVDSEDSYSGYIDEKFSTKRKYELDYSNLICCDCKKNKADLIRGTQDYLCADCFKKWIAEKNKKVDAQEKLK